MRYTPPGRGRYDTDARDSFPGENPAAAINQEKK